MDKCGKSSAAVVPVEAKVPARVDRRMVVVIILLSHTATDEARDWGSVVGHG